jgi:hypothetical protein
MEEPWDGVMIYKSVGIDAGIDTFPSREPSRRKRP